MAVALLPGLASAQQADTETTTLDRLEVTGSRIRGVEIENQQPVLVLSREELQRQGFTSVADVLQNLTSAGAPAISRSEPLASGEDVGGYYINIRSLGADRTLILLNGQRLGTSTSGLSDLGQIPMSAIERIDILKDGASSIYGSDAIAGVVNIITRKHMDGGEAEAYFGQYSDGDGDITRYSLTLGTRGARGGMTLSAEYTKEEPVWARDRWYSRDGNAGPAYPESGWSIFSHLGFWDEGNCPATITGVCTLNPGGDTRNPNDYHELTPDEFANSNQQMMVRTALERKSLYLNGSYSLSDRIELNTDILYNDRSTVQQVAGYPYYSASFDTLLSGDSAFTPTPGEDLHFGRRLWEVPRTTDNRLKTLRFAPSLNGYFEAAGRTFDWSIGAMWNRNENTKIGHGDMSLIASRQALGPSFIDGAGVARCGTAANPIDGCLAWNPLLPFGVAGAGSLADADLQAFLFPFYTDTGVTSTTVYNANLSGSIVTLPAGDLGFAVGVEHRSQRGRFVPDAMAQSGEFTGLAAAITEGRYKVDEAYLELNVPLLADLPGVKELTLNLATRYSDYDTFGNTTNSKFGLVWRPLNELLVRATWAEGFRAPAISDLYGGPGESFEFYTDPCSVGVPGSVAGNAACTAAGVSPTYVQLGQGGVPCTGWPCQTNDPFISGSNPDLSPETSKSKTAGLVWSPRRVNGLDLNLDWYNYQIKDAIRSESIDIILRDCYVLGNADRCTQAGVTRAADGHITAMSYTLVNFGKLETEGWDLGIRYRLPELAIGRISLDWQNSYIAKYDQEVVIAGGDSIMAGAIGAPGLFRLRSNLGINWTINNFTVAWNARYYSGMKESCVRNRPCTDPDHIEIGESAPLRKVGSNTFNDVQFSWQAPWNGTVSVGANNVLDHKGPIMFRAPSSQFAYYGGFDIGRFVYMKYQQRF